MKAFQGQAKQYTSSEVQTQYTIHGRHREELVECVHCCWLSVHVCVCVCVCAHDRTKEQQSNGMPLQIALPFVCYVEVIPLWEVVICADEWCWICKDSL